MSGINWNLATRGSQNALAPFAQGLEAGQKMREHRERKEYRSALGVLAQDPHDRAALSTVFAHDPRAGVALADRADDLAFRRDTAEMIAPDGQPNALLSAAGMGSLPQQSPNALSATSQPIPLGGETVHQNPNSVEREARATPDLSSLGQPKSKEDAAFLRMLKRDPLKALEIRSELRDNFVAQVQTEADFYGLAMGELSRATDPNSWALAFQRVAQQGQALGMDISAVVPSDYPGPEGVQQLMRRAQPIKEQLDLIVREANIDADNARADRNTDSLIETREGRLDEYERHNRASESNQRRGQDLTDARVRSGRSSRKGRRKTKRKGGGEIVDVSTPDEARALPPGTRFRTPDGEVITR